MEGDESMYQAKGSAAVRGNAAKGAGPLFFLQRLFHFLRTSLQENHPEDPKHGPNFGSQKRPRF